MRKLIILMLIPVQLAVAQDKIFLYDCYRLAEENFPELKNAQEWRAITSLRKENLKTGYLPQVSVNGQATYQSDVIEINIPLPDFSIPSVPKDQYKGYAEIRQTIWDGGVIEANSRLEDAVLKSNLSELEVEIYKLKDQVAQAFFTALAMEKQKDVLVAQKAILIKKLESVRSGIKNQVITESESYALEAEIMMMEQNITEVLSGKSAALKVLSILTGKDIPDNCQLQFSETPVEYSTELARPESQLFSNKIMQLKTQMELLDKSRNPKIFGFGQAGYGKPGLNMLNDDFDSYYLVGIGLAWTPFDWKKTIRQKQTLEYQQKLITHQEETFNRNMEVLLAQQKEHIIKFENQLKKDQDIIDLKSKITQVAESRLENGTITSSDYITELQSETIAKLNKELHKIRLHETKEKYMIIKGADKNMGK